MKPARHIIVAGMTLTLAFGMTPASAFAAQESDSEIVENTSGDTSSVDSESVDSSALSVEAPASYDKSDFYSEDPTAALARSLVMPLATTFTPVNVSAEMRYFSKWESHSNYDQGLSWGDGYHAMGYYQFDNRYGLDSFLIACYNYDPSTYSMFKWIADGADITGELYNSSTGTLTSVGQKLEDSWHAAYKANPAGFSALQDSWAFEKYYKPAERYLKSVGIDISERADCVKGLVWGMSNLFGTSGWKKFVGGVSDGYDWNGVYHYLSEGYKWPGAWGGDYAKANAMSDREFVTTLCNYVVENVAVFYKGQPQYHEGWQNRYQDELVICLSYIAEDEAQQKDSLAYDANGGVGTMEATEGFVNKGVTVAANAFVRDGYTFTGWNTKGDGSGTAYAAGSTYGLTDGNDVLYAQWEKIEEPVVPSVPDAPGDSSQDDVDVPDNGGVDGGSNAGSGSGGGQDDGAGTDGDASGNDVPDDGVGDDDAANGGSSDGDGGTDGSSGDGDASDDASGDDDATQRPAPPANGPDNDASDGGASNVGSDAPDDSGSASGDSGNESGAETSDGGDGKAEGADGDNTPKGDALSGDKTANDGKNNAADESGKKDASGASDDDKETLLKTNDESAGIVAVLVGGFALAFGVAAGTLRRMLGRS